MTMTGAALFFFVLFALTIFATYIGVRRGWASTGTITLVGAAGSIVTMTLFSRGQGNNWVQAVVVGFLVGSVFVAAAVAIASFFRSNEARPRAGRRQPPSEES